MPSRPPVLVATLPTPWGPLHAGASGRGIAAVHLLTTREAFHRDLARTWDAGAGPFEGRAQAADHLDRLSETFAAYLRGDASTLVRDLPLDLVVGSDWDRLVLEGVRGIVPGHVESYGDVARRIGRAGAARAVGGAVGRNPIAILVPCHRVIAAGGRIGGYGGDWYGTRQERLAIKRDLLRLEGVTLADDVAGAA